MSTSVAGWVAQVSGLDRPRPVPVVDESGGPGVDEAGALAGRVADVSREGRPSAARVLLDLKAARGVVGADIAVRESSSRPVPAVVALYENRRGGSGEGSGTVVAGRAGTGVDRSGAVEVPEVPGADRVDAGFADAATGPVIYAVPAESGGAVDRPSALDDEDGRHGRPLETGRVPVEGPDNRLAAPVESRPSVVWRDGDEPFAPGDLTFRDPVVYVVAAKDSGGPGGRTDWPGSGLGTGVAWPDPSHTATERRELAAAGRASAADVLGANNWSNAKYAGELYGLDGTLHQKFPHGVRFSYEGFPIFDDYAVRTVRLEEGFAPRLPNGRADRSADEKRANAIFGWNETPDDMTWHHKEDAQTMILMNARLHDKVRHWGGERVIKVREQRE